MQECVRAASRDLGRLVQRRRDAKVSSRRHRRFWVKAWLARREELGASATLLREMAETCPEDYRNHLRMNECQFLYLLEKVGPVIQKQDTTFRKALPAATKLKMVLRYLATGDKFSTLSALYRVDEGTLSKFLPETCDAIYSALEGFIQVG